MFLRFIYSFETSKWQEETICYIFIIENLSVGGEKLFRIVCVWLVFFYLVNHHETKHHLRDTILSIIWLIIICAKVYITEINIYIIITDIKSLFPMFFVVVSNVCVFGSLLFVWVCTNFPGVDLLQVAWENINLYTVTSCFHYLAAAFITWQPK